MTLKLVWFYLIAINKFISSSNLIINNSPELNVFTESTQIISWDNPINTNGVKIDLYTSNSYKGTIYKINKSVNYFNWLVPDNSIIGNKYFLHITAYYNNTKTVSNNTSLFNIVKGTSKSKIYFILTVVGGGIIILITLICVCKNIQEKYLPDGIITPIFNIYSPKKLTPRAACTPPKSAPIMIQQQLSNPMRDVNPYLYTYTEPVNNRDTHRFYRDFDNNLRHSGDINQNLITPHVTKDDIGYYY